MEREEGGSGWGTHVNPWLIYVSVWQKTLHYYKVISLELIKISEKKKKKRTCFVIQGSWVQFLVRELRSQMPWGNQAHASQLLKAVHSRAPVL